jgi:DNA (cytosine-5)-methyltransferase 1
LEDNVDEKYYLSDKMIEGMKNTNFESYKLENKLLDKNGIANTIIARFEGTPQCIKVAQLDGFESSGRVYGTDGLAPTINTMGGGNREPKIATRLAKTLEKNSIEDGDFIEVFDFRYDEGIRGRVDNNLSPTITTKAGSKGLSGQPFIKVPQATKQGYAIAEIGDGIYTNRTESKRGVVQKESVPTLKTSPNDLAVVVDDSNRLIAVRRLTPRECWRLMGWKDSDIDRALSTGVSETQLYKMAGNSIVVNCLTEIFKRLNEGGKENV